MKYLLSGASGFLGSALRVQLAQLGHEVVRLVRHSPASAHEVRWDPAQRSLDPAVLDGVDVVVNLSGAGIADRPWTESRRRELLSSRIDPTATLCEALAAASSAGTRPALLQGSAIAWYGLTSGPEPHREGEPAATDFLAQVVAQWEASASPAVEAGLRVAFLRTTAVLDRSGGMFPLLKLPFTVGLGARLGDGSQHMAIIGLRDWLRAVDFVATHDVSGPVNLTIPVPATNAELTTALGGELRRPTFLRAPAPLLRLGGDLTESLLLADQKVVPAALQDAGFTFEHPDVTSTIAAALARS